MTQSPTPDNALEYYRSNQDTYLEQLKSLTRIPGIDFPGFPQEELTKSAQEVLRLLTEAGLEHTELLEVPGAPPYVYGEWLHAPDAPTFLLYAHYDVQPAMREDVWESPAFEPTLRDGRLYARGISDDKAGIILHVASIQSWLKTEGTLPVNVKVIIEGEEETGSTHLEQFLSNYTEKLKADCLVIADGANYDVGLPSLTTSLRGLIGLEVSVRALKNPLHSGLWGGALPDPVQGLSKILATLLDDQGKIAVPGMLDDVRTPAEEELEDIRRLGMTDNTFRKQSGLVEGATLFGKDEELLLKSWKEPSLVVNSIVAGGKDAGNVLLDAALARITVRLVQNMDPQKCADLLQAFIKEVCPWGLEVDVSLEASVGPWQIGTDHPVFKTAKEALKKGYGAEAVYIGSGGTIPFADPLSKIFGNIPALLVGVEDPYTNAHAENESLSVSEFHRAVESQIHFFAGLSQPGSF